MQAILLVAVVVALLFVVVSKFFDLINFDKTSNFFLGLSYITIILVLVVFIVCAVSSPAFLS